MGWNCLEDGDLHPEELSKEGFFGVIFHVEKRRIFSIQKEILCHERAIEEGLSPSCKGQFMFF